ncbi:MAG TPA: arsenite methyltransferase [Ilumatobacteraceae bacterium]|nr:arsenite methyltransferase [Ilumatobacteraceae bacterium]
MTAEADTLRDEIRRRYAEAANTAAGGQQATDGPPDACLGTSLYDDLDGIPEGAGLASLGCGNPIAVADLAPGETVLDLGSGGGIDVLFSAKRVGPSGHVYGLDMTDEMLELARRNATEADATNVTFLKGHIERIPLPDASIDVVISNCVVNLSTDKPSVFAEMHRVLRHGGRIGISDVVAADDVPPEEIGERAARVGCLAGAVTFDAYRRQLGDAGFDDITVASTHEFGDGIHSAIIRAVNT